MLSALTFHDVFKAGANYYGVSDLEALARDTHKFESRYLERLVAPWPQGRAIYEARSPIDHLEGFRAPLIVFQGADDKVVPPGRSRAIVAALKSRGIPVAYIEFEGEQHGLRRADIWCARSRRNSLSMAACSDLCRPANCRLLRWNSVV